MEGMQQTISWLTEAVEVQKADPGAPFIPPPEKGLKAIIAYLEFSVADINAEQHREAAALLKKIIPIYSPAVAGIAYHLRQATTNLRTILAKAIQLRETKEIAKDEAARKYTKLVKEIAEDGKAREYAKKAEEMLRKPAENPNGRFAMRPYCDELFKELEDTLKECDAEILRQRGSFQAGEENCSPCITEIGGLVRQVKEEATEAEDLNEPSLNDS